MIARPDGRIYMCGLLGLAPYIGKLRRGVLVEAIGLFARAAPRAASNEGKHTDHVKAIWVNAVLAVRPAHPNTWIIDTGASTSISAKLKNLAQHCLTTGKSPWQMELQFRYRKRLRRHRKFKRIAGPGGT